MIYCNLKGGLANMLFQIAATKSMAIDLGVDCSFPNLIQQYHTLNADSFYNPRLEHSFEYQEMFHRLRYTPPTQPLPFIRYPFEYVKFDTPSDNFIIDGFFQTEKYFKHNKEQIIEFLKIPNPIDTHIKTKYSKLLETRTTSIHIRHGDYFKFPNHHPVLSMDYYKRAIDIVKNETDNFIIFSDDIEWCKHNFDFINPTYIDDEKDYIEIYLMSMCNNNIIANSSFSLWAASMNQNKDKIIVGPKTWFGPQISFNTIDVLSDNWVKL